MTPAYLFRLHPLNSENLHRGKHVSKSMRVQVYSSPAISVLDRVLASGVAAGVFRSDVAARDVYLLIASMAYFYLSNRFTLSAFLGENLEAPAALAHWEGFVTEVGLRAVAPAAASSAGLAPALDLSPSPGNGAAAEPVATRPDSQPLACAPP